MTRYFFVYIINDERADGPQIAGKERDMPKLDPKLKKTMDANCLGTLQSIIYSIYGNVWRMPKQVRDRYRAIEPASDTHKGCRTRHEERKA